MKARRMRVAALVAAGLGTIVVVGCDVSKLLPGSTTPTPPAFKTDAKLIGRFTFQGKAPSATNLVATYRKAGESVAADAEKAAVDGQGYFQFTSGSIAAGSEFQVVFNDGGELVENATTNVVGQFVSDPLKGLGASDTKKVQVEIDLLWEPSYNPKPDATFAGSFTFNKIPNLDADYFVSVFTYPKGTDAKTATKSACWSSKSGSETTVTWGKVCSTTAGATTGDVIGSDKDLLYQYKFVKKGTSQSFAGKKEFFGQSKFVKFKM